MPSQPIRATSQGVEVDVLVVPNASRSSVVGIHGDRVKIRIALPPEKNKANRGVCSLLEEATGARSASVLRGRTARHKTVLLPGVSHAHVMRSLAVPAR